MSKIKCLKFTDFVGVMHFVGIGGIGMSGIAEIMHNLGYKVQGSDVALNDNVKRLQQMGIKIFIGHSEDNVIDASVLVKSSAVKDDNPEIQASRIKAIPIIKRSEMLAEIMRLKISIAVSGSHGKTTTTSLVANLFETAGLKPTVINGGIINSCGTNAYLGEGDYLIAEADESDATFIKIPSTIGVITSIDPEHLDFYGDFNALKNAFLRFFENLPFYGFGVACLDHPEVKNLLNNIIDKEILTYSIKDENADIYAFNIRQNNLNTLFDIKISGKLSNDTKLIENILLPIPGLHNVLNSLAAIVIGLKLNFDLETIVTGFRNFKGVLRRFTKAGEFNGINIVDDYAHHPKEVEATLATAVSVIDRSKGDKVIAILQPHRYTRLRDLFDEFCHCMYNADVIMITDVYSAGENPIAGFSGLELVNGVKYVFADKQVIYVETPHDVAINVDKIAKSGDIVLYLGAGNISKWAYQLQSDLQELNMSSIER